MSLEDGGEGYRPDEETVGSHDQGSEVDLETNPPAIEFAEKLRKSKNPVFFVDLDGTLVHPEKVPIAGCKIDQKAAAALERIANYGVEIIPLTGRAGRQALKSMGEIPCRKSLGTFGWETCKRDENGNVSTKIDKKFEPCGKRLTELISQVEQRFYQLLKNPSMNHADNESVYLVENDEGIVCIDVKGQCLEFPKGITYQIALYGFEPERKIEIYNELAAVYEQYYGDELRELYSPQIARHGNSDTKDSVFKIAVEPFNTGEAVAKRKSMIRAIREGNEEGEVYDFISFFGDTNSDSRAMRTSNLINKMTSFEADGVMVERPGDRGQDKLEKESSYKVEEIGGNAQFLTKIADYLDAQNIKH